MINTGLVTQVAAVPDRVVHPYQGDGFLIDTGLHPIPLILPPTLPSECLIGAIDAASPERGWHNIGLRLSVLYQGLSDQEDRVIPTAVIGDIQYERWNIRTLLYSIWSEPEVYDLMRCSPAAAALVRHLSVSAPYLGYIYIGGPENQVLCTLLKEEFQSSRIPQGEQDCDCIVLPGNAQKTLQRILLDDPVIPRIRSRVYGDFNQAVSRSRESESVKAQKIRQEGWQLILQAVTQRPS